MTRPGGRAALLCVLGVAAAARLWLLATHSYIVFPDETFQYLEPAHRLAFGAGVVTWEYLDGIRNWLLPGALAGVMWLAGHVGDGPDAYMVPIRLLMALASLAIPYAAFRIAERRAGLPAAIAAGLLAGLASEALYFADTVMTEPLATDAAVLALWLGDSAGDSPRPARRLALAGALLGLAATLRYQYAPVLALAALWQHARHGRALLAVAAGGLGVVLPALGLLDWLTWGVPFQSVWLNFLRNATQGVSGAMGTEPWYFYPAYYVVAWGAAAVVLLVLAALGARRAPVLGLVVVGTIALHALTPHKELRFVFLATACLPMLVGIGLGVALGRLPAGRATVLATALALAIAGMTGWTTLAGATPPDAWHRDRQMLRAFAAARDVAGACGLGVRSVWVYRSGGYTYWHRDLPIYFETWDAAQHLDTSAFRLRLESVVGGRPVPQYPGPALAAHAGAFNVLIGTPQDMLPGFSPGPCFAGGEPREPTYCVFTRPGGCD